MQIQIDFMARFKKKQYSKESSCVSSWKVKGEKREKNNASKMKKGLDMSCVWKKEVNQQSVNWIQVP